MCLDMQKKPTYKELKKKIAALEQELEVSLKESEMLKMRKILDSFPYGICLVNSEHQIKFVNKPLRLAYGDPGIRRCHEYFHLSPNPCGECPNEDVFQGRAVHREWYSAKNDTTYEIIDIPVENEDGSIWKMEVFHDITSYRCAQKELSENKRQVETLLSNLPGMAYRCDSAWTLQFVSQGCEQLTGFTPEDLIGSEYLSYATLVSSEDRERIRSSVQQALRENRSFELSYHLVTAQGEIKYVLEKGRGISDPDGPVQWIEGFVTDITKQKQMEHELINQNRFIATILDNLPIGLAVNKIDAGTAMYMNKQFEEIYGWPEEEINCVERFFEKVYPDSAYRDEIMHRVLADITSGDKNRMIWEDFEATGKDGRKKIINAKNIPLYEQNLMISTVQDITEARRLQEQLARVQRMEAIGTLAGGIAHDFNNILTSVLGYADIAMTKAKSFNSTELISYLKEINIAGMRARDLVKQILSFARQTKEEQASIQVASIVKEVLKFLRSTIPATIQIKQNITSQSNIKGSAIQIHQILMNLCTNAVQAMGDQGGILAVNLKNIEISDSLSEVSILGLKPGEYLELIVADTGHGIPSAHLNSIFEPYFTTKPHGEGTGLGLAVVHGIVKKYGGAIKAASILGKETIFTVYLPRLEDQPQESTHREEKLPSGTETILLVDDDVKITRIIETMLKTLGYTIVTRNRSKEALSLVNSNPYAFDVVITDLTMPEMNGDKLAKEIMKIRENIPVIIISGYHERLSEVWEDLGIKVLLSKPVVRSELALAIRSVLDKVQDDQMLRND